MNLDEFSDLLARFTKLDNEKMDVEDSMQVTLETMKFLKRLQPIIDKYNPKYKPPDKTDITNIPDDMFFKFNEYWRFIDGEQD